MNIPKNRLQAFRLRDLMIHHDYFYHQAKERLEWLQGRKKQHQEYAKKLQARQLKLF